MIETCSDCFVQLPKLHETAPIHRYLGGSASCWDQFSWLNNAGEPPVAAGRYNALLIDAYCVQHHGIPIPPAINSVAVHGIALYAAFEMGMSLDKAVWVRQFSTFGADGKKHGQFVWLTPPDQKGCVTINDIVTQPTPEKRAEMLDNYVLDVWATWKAVHLDAFADWYDRFVAS